MSERVMNQVVLWSTVVLGVAGGALGVSFFKGLVFPQTLIIVAFCALLGVALALLGVSGEEAPEPQPINVAPLAPPPLALTSAPVPIPAPARTANSEWWNQTARPATSPPTNQVAKKAVPLADFDAHKAQIAQCPHCAGFDLDAWREGEAYRFACRNPHCRTTWEWLPGTAWPPTVVRNNLTRATSVEEEHR